MDNNTKKLIKQIEIVIEMLRFRLNNHDEKKFYERFILDIN